MALAQSHTTLTGDGAGHSETYAMGANQQETRKMLNFNAGLRDSICLWSWKVFLLLFLVEVHHNLVTDRVGLASQYKAGLPLTGLQTVGDVHINFTLYQFRLAG